MILWFLCVTGVVFWVFPFMLLFPMWQVTHLMERSIFWGCSQAVLDVDVRHSCERSHSPGTLVSFPSGVWQWPLHPAPFAQNDPCLILFAQEMPKRAPEVELNAPHSCPATQEPSFRYARRQEGSFLCKSQTRPHRFREITSFTDEAAVKWTFKSAMTLQPKQVLAVGQDVRPGISASSCSAHFPQGVAFKSFQASELLMSLLAL